MQAFVRAKNSGARKDESRASTDDIHDLKVPVPALNLQDPAYPASTQPVASSNASGGKKIKKSVPTFSSQAKQDSDQYKHYLTPEDAASFDEIDDFDSGFKPLPGDEIEKLKQKKLAEINGPRLTDKYIDGDSYPDTTSGRLTDIDPAEFQASAAQDLPELPQTSAFRMAPPPRRIKSQQKGVAKESTRLKEGIARAGTEQAFHSDMKPQQAMNSAEKPYAMQQSEPFFKRPDIAFEEPRFMTTTPKHNHSKKRSAPNKESRKSTAQHMHSPYAALDEAMIDGEDVENVTAVRWPPSNIDTRASNQNHARDVVEQPGVLLDYDDKDLHKLQYEQLKAEDFDKDPRAPQRDSSQTLDLKADLSLEEWAIHFESLTIDKWEDAGDWFVTQFTDILSRIKSVRRAKRAIAQQFEQEVEDRHNAIVKKRIIIRDTMQGMRTHGAQVLDQHESDAKETT